MLPSKKIVEIYHKGVATGGLPITMFPSKMVAAILNYLDEEYKKENKEMTHEVGVYCLHCKVVH